MKAHSGALPCFILLRKANKRLVLCVTVLLYCPVVESISGAGQSCAGGMQVFMLLSEFRTVQVLKGPKNLSASRNSEASAFGSILKYCINGSSIGTDKVAM